uniref:Chromosome partition protein Smc n=1 Tax=Pseudomonas phage Nican01 TaxID=3138540 RepID=A0AAU6W039_9CAUD
MGLKQITPGYGSGGGSGDGPTDEQLDQIGGVANDAKVLAQSAKSESAAAGAKADAAKTAADGYSEQITTAAGKADAAKTAADAASAAAAAASGKADGVTATAADAKSKAEAAQSAAATAGTKADAAKATADGLDARVTTAANKADAAKTAADAAAAQVAAASSKADAAKTAADDAKAIAVGFETRIDDVESTQGGYTQVIAEATATANEANIAALAAKNIADDLADDVASAVAKADTAKSAADAAAVSAAEAKVTAGQANTKVAEIRTDTDENASDIVALENRVGVVETAAANATTAANQAGSKADDLANDVQAAQDAADLANDLIGDLTGRVGSAELAIADLQTNGGGSGPAYDDTAVKSRLTIIESDVATLKGTVAGLGGAVMMEYLSVWGDSRTAQNWNSTGNAILARGYGWWAEALSGRVRMHLKYNFGVSGDSIQQLLDRINNDTANASGVKPSQVPPSHAVVHIGTNSINAGNSVASCTYQLNQVINWLIGKGHTVYVVSEWPRGLTASGNAMLTADNQKIMYGYAREVRKLARAKKIKVIDCWPAMADPTLNTAQPRLNYLNGDGLHPSIGAGFLTGKLIAKALEENNAHKIAYPPGSQDQYDATSNKEGVLNTNPMLVGTGGTKATNATGDVPDAWTLTPSTGLSVVSSKITLTMPDGTKREATRLVISGTPAVNGSVMLRVPNTTRANTTGVWYGKINDGDILEGWAEIQVAGDFVNMSNVTCNLVADTTALSALGGTYTSGGSTGDLQWPDNLKQGYSAIIRSPELVVGASHTTFQFEVRAYFLEAIASSLTVDILSAGVRKKFPLA